MEVSVADRGPYVERGRPVHPRTRDSWVLRDLRERLDLAANPPASRHEAATRRIVDAFEEEQRWRALGEVAIKAEMEKRVRRRFEK